MPRQVDHIARRRDITTASVRILARGGPQALTLRSLAEELGGSITLVTHFFANRADLFAAVVDDLIASYETELNELEAGADDLTRLVIFLRWMLPLSPEDVQTEAGRVSLISHRDEHASIQRFFDVMEDRMRALLRSHLEPLELSVELDVAAAFLRATVNGIVLSAVEHPDLWPAQVQLASLNIALNGLGIHTIADSQAAVG